MMSLNPLPLIDTYTAFPVTTDPDTHFFNVPPVFFFYPWFTAFFTSSGSATMSCPRLPINSQRAVDGHFLPGSNFSLQTGLEYMDRGFARVKCGCLIEGFLRSYIFFFGLFIKAGFVCISFCKSFIVCECTIRSLSAEFVCVSTSLGQSSRALLRTGCRLGHLAATALVAAGHTSDIIWWKIKEFLFLGSAAVLAFIRTLKSDPSLLAEPLKHTNNNLMSRLWLETPNTLWWKVFLFIVNQIALTIQRTHKRLVPL